MNTQTTTTTTTTTVTVVPTNCQVYQPQDQNKCLICEYGYIPNNGLCEAVSPFCDGHNVQTGECFGCKFNLDLQDGKCID